MSLDFKFVFEFTPPPKEKALIFKAPLHLAPRCQPTDTQHRTE
jgi:hypothetical protein